MFFYNIKKNMNNNNETVLTEDTVIKIFVILYL